MNCCIDGRRHALPHLLDRVHVTVIKVSMRDGVHFAVKDPSARQKALTWGRQLRRRGAAIRDDHKAMVDKWWASARQPHWPETFWGNQFSRNKLTSAEQEDLLFYLEDGPSSDRSEWVRAVVDGGACGRACRLSAFVHDVDRNRGLCVVAMNLAAVLHIRA